MPKLIRTDETVSVPDELPAIALRDLVFFPYMVLPLLIGRPRSTEALDAAREREDLLLLLPQRDPEIDDPSSDDLYRVGTVIRIIQASQLPDGTNRVVMEGLGRAEVESFLSTDAGESVKPTERSTSAGPPSSGSREPFRARIRLLVEREAEERGASRDPEREAQIRRIRRQYDEYVHLHERMSGGLSDSLGDVEDAVRMAHLMSGHVLAPVEEKQELLECRTLSEHLDGLDELLARELEILRIEEKLDAEIQHQMETGRRTHYLQEQLKAIQKELDTRSDEWSELEQTLAEADLPEEVRARADRELERLERLNPVAPEAAVIRTYLDWIASLPWTRRSDDNLSVENAARILDEEHHGLEEVKERILDHIAVLSLVGELQGPILCLVGPPGVGKTSLGQSIARALGREFIRASLGGVRDEAEIRGHRRTYVGALPGRIIQGMRRSGTRNPVFLLDEVDKLARDFHGDPGAALLEVLDPEQNESFTDHYLEMDFDLSDVFFVATANTLAGIPGPLQDRMEVIRLPGYLDTEKRVIARRFLWPRQAERHGLAPDQVRISDDALDRIIGRYTREAGVRELERQISRVARKLARRVADGKLSDSTPIDVEASTLRDLLGPPRHTSASRDGEERSGIANGLAWTPAGGEVLDVEVAVIPGSGKTQLTGTLGDVMKESAFAAVTYARSRARMLGLDGDFHEKVDIHIHIPEGATPKDGPSAGITIAVALISALTGIPTHPAVAMTGEITLRGRVLAVGGIKEKAVAALRNGIERVLLPTANETDLELLPDEVREGVEFVPVGTMDEVISAALVRLPKEATPTPGSRLEGTSGMDASAGAGVQIS
ncbi:MAG: endopeptidase La [Longimicrobiales bacterium]|nr:endopeptidase La [Longimicrobiales bacterium]